MNEKDEESERDADYKEWNYWQEQMNEKDEEGCEGGCVCCGFEDLKDDDASKKKKNKYVIIDSNKPILINKKIITEEIDKFIK